MTDLHSRVAMERALAAVKTREKFGDMEDEATETLTGEALDARLAALRAEKQDELDRIKSESEANGRQAEITVREQQEERFYQEKEALLAKDEQRKKAMLQQLAQRSADDQ